jgi:hypothetical protein
MTSASEANFRTRAHRIAFPAKPETPIADESRQKLDLDAGRTKNLPVKGGAFSVKEGYPPGQNLIGLAHGERRAM